MKFKSSYVMIILGLLLGGVMIYSGLTIDYSTKIVDCYDRWDNKIIGETCLDEYEPGEESFVIILGFLTFILFFMMGKVCDSMDEIFKPWGNS